ncbi:hypothetical protein NE237_030801 [Protea cynaroides]|uniref:Retrotransposon gag domain-containing protein n=1 Tax=Protea cynaroides TaxID=273540 RepID=A0A9Q0GUT8_9MAGN|nr:hypothetical protein NE237_030801 [Protea cynaroides]
MESIPTAGYQRRFDGVDPNRWISKANWFYDFHGTADDQRLLISSFHLDGAALQWFQGMRTTQFLTWSTFTRSLEVHFDPHGAFNRALQLRLSTTNPTSNSPPPLVYPSLPSFSAAETKISVAFLETQPPHLSYQTATSTEKPQPLPDSPPQHQPYHNQQLAQAAPTESLSKNRSTTAYELKMMKSLRANEYCSSDDQDSHASIDDFKFRLKDPVMMPQPDEVFFEEKLVSLQFPMVCISVASKTTMTLKSNESRQKGRNHTGNRVSPSLP